ncbi:hypothetical protein HQ590_08375 [bacterium]|nr:hypothetical protein [bacterium]
MKITRLLSVPCLLVLALALSARTALGQSVYAAHPLTMSLSLAVQDTNGVDQVIQKLKTTNTQIINLARNRDPDAAVPANEILVLLLECETGDAQIAVWDLNANDVLVPVTHTFDLDEHIVVQTKNGVTKKALFGTVAAIDNSSSPLFALLGGSLMLTGSAKGGGGDGCPASAKIAVSGYLEVRITDDVGTKDIEALITKGKAKARAPIDFIIP